MGTIRVVELNQIGGQGAVDGSPVANLSGVIKITVDSTTSTTAETITLDPDTRYVVITADSLHRVSVKSLDASARYITVDYACTLDAAVNKEDRTLAYRLDA